MGYVVLFDSKKVNMMTNIPRPEHPRPQWKRDAWQNLNGTWQFEIDNGRSGLSRGLASADTRLNGGITVPFCPQSKLSGVGYKDFLYGVWYKREVEIQKERLDGRVFLHIGAADYACTAFINGVSAGTHRGGYVSFSFEITHLLHGGTNVITLYCEDDERDRMIPRGKQSEEYHSHGCDYTRTTGIWQTVWLEFTPKEYLSGVRFYPDPHAGTLTLQGTANGIADLHVTAFYEGREVGNAHAQNVCGAFTLSVDLSETHLWEVGNGRLYDLKLTYGEDEVQSYFALRSIAFDGDRFLLNGKSVFQRLVLDQGFYPDGIYTAPTDKDLHGDILLSKAMGFNGARLHEKVFEERFLYHCDREGYLVWGEFPNWGLDHSRPESVYGILPEWIEEVNRDFNHPSIIGWCPFNETWDQGGRKQYDPLLALVYRVTKAIDLTRPCIDTSGNYHVETDVFDLHDYEPNPDVLRAHFEPFAQGGAPEDRFASRQPFMYGKPVFVSEYGGIGWSVQNGWSYGNAPKTEEEFLTRFAGLADVLLDHPRLFGFCYTQLTDIEQEQNGLYSYDRVPKFDPSVIRAILSRKAKIEE